MSEGLKEVCREVREDEGDCRLRMRDRNFRRKRCGMRIGREGGQENPSLVGENIGEKAERDGLYADSFILSRLERRSDVGETRGSLGACLCAPIRMVSLLPLGGGAIWNSKG